MVTRVEIMIVMLLSILCFGCKDSQSQKIIKNAPSIQTEMFLIKLKNIVDSVGFDSGDSISAYTLYTVPVKMSCDTVLQRAMGTASEGYGFYNYLIPIDNGIYNSYGAQNEVYNVG